MSTISSKYPQRFSDVVEMFDSAEDYLWSFLTQMVNRGFVGQIRQVALSLASIVIIRGILVKRETINSNGLAVTLIGKLNPLDGSLVITIDRSLCGCWSPSRFNGKRRD